MKRFDNDISFKKDLSLKGFTLVEMLLGIVMFSILSVCVFATYSAGMKISRKAEDYNHFYREINLSVFGMCREIENMVFYNFENSYPEKSSFVGKEDSLSFILPQEEGLVVVSYYLIPAQSSRLYQVLVGNKYKKNVAVQSATERVFGEDYLVREERSFVDFLQGESAGEGEIVVVSTKIKSGGLRFSYGYSGGESKQENVWQDEWGLKNNPRSIKVEIDYYVEGEQKETKTISKEIYIPTGSQGTERI